MIKSVQFATGLITFGLILLLGSFAWPLLLPQEVIWNEEQAREKATAAADLHNLTHRAAHVEIDNSKEEEKQRVREQLKLAQSRFANSKEELNRGRRFRDITAMVLRCSGIALALVGIVRYKIIQSDDRNNDSRRR